MLSIKPSEVGCCCDNDNGIDDAGKVIKSSKHVDGTDGCGTTRGVILENK